VTKRSKRYTEQERARILSQIAKANLTGKQAAKQFGVSEVSLWKWRKAASAARQPRAARNGRIPANSSLVSTVRAAVHARVRELLPSIVRDEVARAFGSKPSAR
jgi:transposase-like protein